MTISNRVGTFGATLPNLRILCSPLLALCFVATFTLADPPGDNDDNPYPPDNDPSQFTGPLIGDLPDDLPDANLGSFEGGRTGTSADAGEYNSIAEYEQRDDGKFNVPTNGPPSPLFGAQPFSQQMLRFEEFGSERLNLNRRQPLGNWRPLPAPVSAQATPDGAALEKFLAQKIWPMPSKYANDQDSNPWQSAIESWLGRELDSPPAEGRPPGLGWSHQRWDEFTPEVYYQTATTGARTNGGFRDKLQDHRYRRGEFGLRGLYHNTAGAAGFEGTTNGIGVRFHPYMPEQEHTALWTFDGTFRC
jgi:hypothetical protein